MPNLIQRSCPHSYPYNYSGTDDYYNFLLGNISLIIVIIRYIYSNTATNIAYNAMVNTKGIYCMISCIIFVIVDCCCLIEYVPTACKAVLITSIVEFGAISTVSFDNKVTLVSYCLRILITLSSQLLHLIPSIRYLFACDFEATEKQDVGGERHASTCVISKINNNNIDDINIFSLVLICPNEKGLDGSRSYHACIANDSSIDM